MVLSWQDWSSIVGAIGGVCGMYALYQNSQQTKLSAEQTQLMRDQAEEVAQQDREERLWAERHEALGNRLARLGPQMMIADPAANSHFCLYLAVFPDPQFRIKLETYVVEPNASRTEFRPRKSAPHELRSQALRDTITTAERVIEKYARENSKVQLMYYLGADKRI